jgi:hypothetical protein
MAKNFRALSSQASVAAIVYSAEESLLGSPVEQAAEVHCGRTLGSSVVKSWRGIHRSQRDY